MPDHQLLLDARAGQVCIQQAMVAVTSKGLCAAAFQLLDWHRLAFLALETVFGVPSDPEIWNSVWKPALSPPSSQTLSYFKSQVRQMKLEIASLKVFVAEGRAAPSAHVSAPTIRIHTIEARSRHEVEANSQSAATLRIEVKEIEEQQETCLNTVCPARKRGLVRNWRRILIRHLNECFSLELGESHLPSDRRCNHRQHSDNDNLGRPLTPSHVSGHHSPALTFCLDGGVSHVFVSGLDNLRRTS